MQPYITLGVTEFPVECWRVKCEFDFNGILYAVGVVRMVTGAERGEFIQSLRRCVGDLNFPGVGSVAMYEEAEKFFNDHFERVTFR